ncbi:MAG: hypothetical protein AAB467_03205 [Patescibacteria group bacterium]
MSSNLVELKSSMLELLGLKGALLNLEKCEEVSSFVAFDLASLNFCLDWALQGGEITSMERRELFAAGVNIGLLSTFDEVRGLALQFKLPIDRGPALLFRACACGNPLRHGRIAFVAGYLQSEMIHTIVDGFNICLEMERQGCSPLDLANVFRQMVEAGLVSCESTLFRCNP